MRENLYPTNSAVTIDFPGIIEVRFNQKPQEKVGLLRFPIPGHIRTLWLGVTQEGQYFIFSPPRKHSKG